MNRSLALWAAASSLLVAGVCATPAASAAPQPIPAGGKGLLADDPLAKHIYSASKDHGTVQTVTVPGEPFAKALRVTSRYRGPEFWSMQLLFETVAPVQRGDTCLVVFWARTVAGDDESGEAKVACYFQKNGPPHNKPLLKTISLPRQWSRVCLPFRSDQAYAPGKAVLCFGTGLGKQVVELGGVQVLNYGRSKSTRDLPRTRRPMPWMAPDAPWRKAAAERIDKIRKADLTVTIVDAAGQPVPGARVTVAMQRHEFGFGSAISIPAFYGREAEAYKKTILADFNRAGTENALKWPAWDGDWGGYHTKANTLNVLRWCKAHDLPVHAHVLVWPSWKHLPRRVRALKNDKPALRKAVADHIVEIMTATKGLVGEWDVVNEPHDNHDLMDILGRDVMVEWFQLAHRTDPKAVLMINDYAILRGGMGETRHRKHYEDTIRFLLDRGAPVQTIGLQSHFGGDVSEPKVLLHWLDRFAKFKLPLQITEFDVNCSDEELIADYTEVFLTIVFSHPAVRDFTMWGFWAGRHWQPKAAMYDRDWTIRPNGKRFRELMYKRWWTNETVRTDRSGRCRVRGFRGDYEVTVRYDGKVAKAKLKLAEGGKAVTVPLR